MSVALRFRRDLLQSAGSSGLGLLLAIVTTPIMARLFPAEAYGVNAMVMTITTIVAGFGLLGLPVALARQQRGAEQTRLLQASVQTAVILSALSIFVISLLFLSRFSLPDGVTVTVIMLIPFLVIINSAQRIIDSLMTATGNFPTKNAASIGNVLTARTLPLALGWIFNPAATLMLLGDGASKIVHVAITLRKVQIDPEWKSISWAPNFHFLRKSIKDYWDFALQSNVASVLPGLVALGVQTMLGIRLGIEAIGYYGLAQSIITMPVTVVALATAPVVFHRFVRTADDAPEKLPRMALMMLLGYLMLGAICMMPIAFFGTTIFVFAFGKAWHSAGVAAAILAIPQIFTFGQVGLLSLFRVARKNNTWLGLELVGSAIVLGGMTLLPRQANLEIAMSTLAKLTFGYNILMISGCLWVSRRAVRLSR